MSRLNANVPPAIGRGPAIKQRPGPQRSAVTVERIDRLAQHIADGGSTTAFTKAEGIYSITTTRLWRMICNDMGPQAR